MRQSPRSRGAWLCYRRCCLHRRNNRLAGSAQVHAGARRLASPIGGALWLAVAAGMLCLSGCWMPPMAVLRQSVPPGPLGTLQVETDVSYARIESVDCGARTVTLRALEPAGTYAVGSRVRNWESLRTGDAVNARIRLELAVYIPAATDDPHRPAARVLNVDQSFRVITLQYASGASDDFKVDLKSPLRAVMPGATVDIHPLEVTSLGAMGAKRSADDAGGCAAGGARPSP